MIQFSERQQQTVAAALTVVAVGIILVAAFTLLYLLGSFLRAFSNVFLPVAVAGVLALILNPYYEWLCTRLRLPRVLALAFLFLSLMLPAVALGWFFGKEVWKQISGILSHVPEWWDQGIVWATERWPNAMEFWRTYPWQQKILEIATQKTKEVVAGLQVFGGKALSSTAVLWRGISWLFSWAVLPVYLAFFLMARSTKLNSRDILPFLKEETRQDVVYLAREFIGIVVSFFRGQLLIALLQGILFALGFSLVGLSYGLILGLLLGFLNIIPYLGSMVGLGICLPLSFLQEGGGFSKTVGVIVVFVVVQLIEGYLLTPKIMGDRTGLHPMAIMIAIFFWGSALGGITGMILAIPLTAFLVVFWRLVKEKYIRELL